MEAILLTVIGLPFYYYVGGGSSILITSTAVKARSKYIKKRYKTQIEKIRLYDIHELRKKSHKFKKYQWDILSEFRELDETLLIEFEHKLNWLLISKYQKLTTNLLDKFQKKLNWKLIITNQKLTDEQLIIFRKQYDMKLCCKYQDFTFDTYIELEKYIDWKTISLEKNLENDIIFHFNHHIKWKYLLRNKKITQDKLNFYLDVKNGIITSFEPNFKKLDIFYSEPIIINPYKKKFIEKHIQSEQIIENIDFLSDTSEDYFYDIYNEGEDNLSFEESSDNDILVKNSIDSFIDNYIENIIQESIDEYTEEQKYKNPFLYFLG
jgi:hypothetical protein